MAKNKFPIKSFWGRSGRAVNAKRQQEKIIDYLKECGSISNSEAYYNLGISQLSVRIAELEAQGIKIKSQYQRDSVNGLTYYLGENSAKK